MIYYWHAPGDRIYLVYAYVKSEREDLTRDQVKLPTELLSNILEE